MLGSGIIINQMDKPIKATPTTASPITAPPKKAILNPSLVPLVHP